MEIKIFKLASLLKKEIQAVHNSSLLWNGRHPRKLDNQQRQIATSVTIQPFYSLSTLTMNKGLSDWIRILAMTEKRGIFIIKINLYFIKNKLKINSLLNKNI